MHTMVVNNLNDYVFVNCGFLFPIHTQEQKIMYQTIIVDYIIAQ
jgi:mRNA degradation ribonuclease J1/J2